MHSGFFCLKHSYPIAEQEKLHFHRRDSYGSHPLKKIPSDRDDTVTCRHDYLGQFLVNLVKIQNIPKCPSLTPPRTLISGPKKISHF
jgi:hypothetical protein